MRSVVTLAVALASAVAPAHAADERKPCETGTLQVPPELKQVSAALKSAHCGSVTMVLRQLLGQRKVGGRKLEGDKPLDVAAAQQERQRALADAEFRQALLQEQQDESDPRRRLLLEAGTLHEFGYFKARDLVLGELAALPRE